MPETLGTDNRPTTSEFHMWMGDKHHFLGIGHDQPSEIECIVADADALRSIRDSMVAADPQMQNELFIETHGSETRLVRLHTLGVDKGDKLLSFFRD